jgi:hypothetical protein
MHRLKKHFLRVNEIFSMIVGQFEVFSKNDGTGWACFLAVAAKDTSDHIDLVSNCIPLSGAKSRLVGVFVSLDIDTACWTSTGTK